MSTADTDRRWLWRLEGMLAVTATSAVHHAMRQELRTYLRETCAHSWDLVPAGQYAEDPSTAPDLLQCRHCHRVRAQATPGAQGEAVRTRVPLARPEDVSRARAAIAAGRLPASPSGEALRAYLHIGPAYARACRDALTSGVPDPSPSSTHEQAAGAAQGAQQ